MSRRPANITQADIARVIRAAKHTGANEVEIRIGDRDAIIVRLAPSTGDKVALEQSGEIVL
jgi:hypothetical protein